jgi:hypothetical protein
MSFNFSNKYLRKKQSKYRNKKITDSEGNKFDSKKEYERWQTLQILQSKGFISFLKRQCPYDLIPSYKGVQRGISYIADFVYLDVNSGKLIVEDCKGFRTEVYKLKKKLMYHTFKIQIKEV